MVEVGSSLVDLSSSGRVELERPEEVSSLLEVRAAGGNLVDEVLDTDNVLLLQDGLNDEVRREWNSLSVDLAETSLVNQSGDGRSGRIAEGDVRLDLSKEVLGSLVSSNEDSVVNLSESEQLEDLLLSRRDGIDTLSSDDEENLWLGRDVDLALCLGFSDLLDSLSLGLDEVLVVSLSSLLPVSLEGLNILSSGFSGLSKFLLPLLVSLLLLLQAFWNWSPAVKRNLLGLHFLFF